MINLQNPTLPIATDAIEIDKAIIEMQSFLSSEITWLTNGYGRAYKNLDIVNGNRLYFPEVYLGTQNNSQRYTNITPDNDKQGQCFFLVKSEDVSNYSFGNYSFLSYDVSIVFSVNLALINQTLLDTDYFLQNCIAEVRDVITRRFTPSFFTVEISSIDLLFSDVFSDFNLTKQQQTEKAPLAHFKINCNIGMNEDCIDVTPPPPSFQNEYSMSFDGFNESIVIDNTFFNIDPSQPFTFSAWVKLNSLPYSINPIVSKYANPTGYFLSINNLGQIRLDLQNNGGINGLRVNSSDTITLGDWQNITVTYDGSFLASGVKMYINGVESVISIANNSLSGGISNTSFLNFGAISSAGLYLDGFLNDFRAWDMVLNSTDVLSEYNGGTPKTPTNEANLLYRCAFGDGATFSGVNWVIPDEVNAFNYNSVNMDLTNRVTDKP